ncbi:helix-turn-helix domain-containing protein [Cryobacterium lactosi]|uniref:Helix-turn-helix domain-containing protein n=2 Tax=Cryobacterium lactosi TaxID=1259202 RepID=A0A4R9BZR7_9MICO|nr:helix-turn-helix domain-containing protein [Cryobacterium lactosi]
MARARELLDTTDQSIAAVASATGYPDSFYFARQFKKVHDMTPSGYRGSGKAKHSQASPWRLLASERNKTQSERLSVSA